jgi:hypothetical protein
MRRYEPIAGITVGQSGSDSTIPVPVNRRLLAIRLYAQGIAAGPVTVYGAAVLADLQIYVGTKLVRNLLAQEALDIANLNGLNIVPSATVGVPIFFVEPWRASVMDEQVSAWDVFGAAAVTIKARTKAALTGVTLSAVVDFDDGFTTNAQGQRVLNIIKQEPINLGSLGAIADIISPTIPVDMPIQRVLLYPDPGVTIQAVKVTVNNNTVVQDMTQAQNIEFLADYKMLAGAGNGVMYPVVFDANQQMFDGLPVEQGIKFHIQQSGPGTIKMVVERRANDYV